MAKAEAHGRRLCGRRLHQATPRREHGMRAASPSRWPTQSTAERAARLAAVAEAPAPRRTPPVYVIGTEVPVPGGATAGRSTIWRSRGPKPRCAPYEVHRERLRARRASSGAFERAVGVVVQPGVEFGHADVIAYEPSEARGLERGADRACRGVVFEAHSTDYQPSRAPADAGRRRFRHPEGRPRADLRAARGAIRSRSDRPDLRSEPARARPRARQWRR